MQYLFYTADVFTDQIFGGNPLAVFPDAAGLSDAQMIRVTKELNLSETVFVLPPATLTGTVKVRIFTPDMEVPFAGHPTIGTAFVLAATGVVDVRRPETHIILEEGVGPVPVTIRAQGGQPTFMQLAAAQMPEPGPPPPPATEIAVMLGLTEADLAGADWSPQAWSAGVPFLFVPLRDAQALARARVRLDVWEQVLADFWAPHVYVFTYNAEQALVRSRMFAPAMGITEDPATGAAAVALAGYLRQHTDQAAGRVQWTIRQGVEMGRPSTLHLEADLHGGQITAVRLGGSAVMVCEGEMEIP
jgi:trans-2,3-dihydro-3-hydroxyanthranilate isomerase